MRPVLIALAVALPVVALAHADHHEDAVKARQSYFTLLGANIGPLAAMAKGEVDYDEALARLHARNLLTLAGYNAIPHFPQGTSKTDLPGKTRALPAIWETPDALASKFKDFNQAAVRLHEVAGNGAGALGPAVRDVGATCKACHDDYRAKDF